jgi:hypothetical protein
MPEPTTVDYNSLVLAMRILTKLSFERSIVITHSLSNKAHTLDTAKVQGLAFSAASMLSDFVEEARPTFAEVLENVGTQSGSKHQG